jgi:hypothetical protein
MGDAFEETNDRDNITDTKAKAHGGAVQQIMNNEEILKCVIGRSICKAVEGSHN